MKHAGILETIEKCFKYCAPKACKVALRSDFVENIINKKSHELLVHFVIYVTRDVLKVFQIALTYHISRAHKSRNALAFMRFPIHKQRREITVFLNLRVLLFSLALRSSR